MYPLLEKKKSRERSYFWCEHVQAASSISLFLSLLLMRKILFPIADQLASTRCTLKWNYDKPMTSIAEESKIPFRVYGNYLPRVIFMESEEVILQVCSVEYTSWEAGGQILRGWKFLGHNFTVLQWERVALPSLFYSVSVHIHVCLCFCVYVQEDNRCAGKPNLPFLVSLVSCF